MKKLLYSPGYGAGWTTWESNSEVRRFMISYQPIIDFLESGEKFTRAEVEVKHQKDGPDYSGLHPVLKTFAKKCEKRFGHAPYLGGAVDLQVLTIPDDQDVQFDEYDGNESYRFRDSGEWF